MITARPQITYKGRVENRGSVSTTSAGANTYIMVDIVKGGGRAPPPPHQDGLIFPS
jgi:hypothetical protein